MTSCKFIRFLSVPSWFGRQSTQRERKLRVIILISSFPLGFAGLRFSWESFIFQLNSSILHTAGLFPKKCLRVAQGQYTLCHPIHRPTSHYSAVIQPHTKMFWQEWHENNKNIKLLKIRCNSSHNKHFRKTGIRVFHGFF